MKFTATTIVLSSVLAVAMSSPALADNWPQWRGPNLNGSCNESSLPEALTKDNLAWSASMPGNSSATPAVWEQKIFLTSVTPEKELVGMCMDAVGGKVLWQKTVGKDKPASNNDMASPSPITDGKTVWFYFGTGDLAAFDMEGKLLWSRNIEKDHDTLSLKFGYSSSPLLYKGKLYILALRGPKPYKNDTPPKGVLDSFLLAVDAQTGKDIWKHVRPTDAVEESFETYSTPTVREGKDRSEIIVFGGDYVTGHDPESGKELWRYGYNPKKGTYYRTVPTPTVGDDLVYCYIPRKYGPAFALKTGLNGKLDETAKAWDTQAIAPDVCCWLLYKGSAYMLNGETKMLYCIDPKTGKARWEGSVASKPGDTGAKPGKGGGGTVFRASPTGADGKIYCIDEKCNVIVLAAGDEFKILSQNNLGDPVCRASIVASGGRVFVRTSKTLFCFARPAGK